MLLQLPKLLGSVFPLFNDVKQFLSLCVRVLVQYVMRLLYSNPNWSVQWRFASLPAMRILLVIQGHSPESWCVVRYVYTTIYLRCWSKWYRQVCRDESLYLVYVYTSYCNTLLYKRIWLSVKVQYTLTQATGWTTYDCLCCWIFPFLS